MIEVGDTVKVMLYYDPYCKDPNCKVCKTMREAIGSERVVTDCNEVMIKVDIDGCGYWFMVDEVEKVD